MANKAIGIVGTVDTITIGGRVFTDLVNLKYLAARVGTADRYSTFRLMNGTGGYQVTGTLTIYAVDVGGGVAGDTAQSTIGYGDTAVTDSAAAPTTPIYIGGDTALIRPVTRSIGSSGGNDQSTSQPISFQVPTNKYPFFQTNKAAISGFAYGYEV